MALPAFASALLSNVAGPLIGGLFSKKGGEDRNKAASAQAQRQMDFQERMSNTAHQREVKDLRAAGLNPILSGTGGAGASSPGGAQAPVQDVLTPAVSSAMAARRLSQEIQNMKATELASLSQADANSARASLSAAQENAIQPAVALGEWIKALFPAPGSVRELTLPRLPNLKVGPLFQSLKDQLVERLRGGSAAERAGAREMPPKPRLRLVDPATGR